MVEKAGRPPLVSRPWPRPFALAQEASWARTTPLLFDLKSSNTWKQQQLDYIARGLCTLVPFIIILFDTYIRRKKTRTRLVNTIYNIYRAPLINNTCNGLRPFSSFSTPLKTHFCINSQCWSESSVTVWQRVFLSTCSFSHLGAAAI